MKLVMTLRTHDEADIVDAVVSFHLNAGVDFVIATDHRSTDGTVEILESYVRAGVLHLIREDGAAVRGREWRTRMARMAATQYGADWTFSCDGDEFWWPRGRSLKDVLAQTPDDYGVVFGLVRPFVPVEESTGLFAERMLVRFSPEASLNDPRSPFRPYYKVAHRADPTVVVHRGNHALHATAHAQLPHWCPLEVLHFPVRTAEQAKRKYVAWARVFRDNVFGTHRRIARLDREGRLDELFGSYALREEALRRGIDGGMLVVDTRLRDVLRALARPERADRGFAVPSELVAPVVLPSSAEPSFVTDRLSAVDATSVRLASRLDRLDGLVSSAERVERGRRDGA